jgi:hypothetical protein
MQWKEELLEAVFSVGFEKRLHKDSQFGLWKR